MLELDEVVRRTGARRAEIVTWIEERLVLPAQEGERWHFSEADLARVTFIIELRRDLAVPNDALPIVLSLVDRLYAMRRALREIAGAIHELPDEQRERVREIIIRRCGGGLDE